MHSPLRKGVYIPDHGSPYEKVIDTSDMSKELNTKYTDHDSLAYLDIHGYKLCMFVRDMAEKSDRVNPMATQISLKTLHYGNVIIGPAILVDDEKDITIDELKKILTIARNTDYGKYRKDCDTRIGEFLKAMKDRS